MSAPEMGEVAKSHRRNGPKRAPMEPNSMQSDAAISYAGSQRRRPHCNAIFGHHP